VKGTIIDLQNFETSTANSVTGNIYDGDHIASVHTLLTVNGTGGSAATLDPLSSTTSAIINGLYGKLTIGIDGPQQRCLALHHRHQRDIYLHP
jgi:hypothetical protein